MNPTDPVIYGAAAVVPLLVAGFASRLPGRRGTHIDPVIALRSE